MAKKKKKKAQQSGDTGKRILDIALSAALIAGLSYYCYRVVSNGVMIDQSFGTAAESIGESETEPMTEPGIIFGTEEIPNSEVHNGPLILVNNFIPLVGSDSGIVSLYSVKLEAESHSFSVRDDALMVKQEVANALIAMFDAFYEETYDDNIVVVSGHRTQEQQQAVYEQYENTDDDESEETAHRAAMPGFSEHQTGLSVDLGLYDGTEYDGTGVYKWIEEHCAEYGLILRYPDGKFDITNIIYEPWHFRYVGFPHASVIMNKGMCFEEYIDYVKEYTYDGEHLRAVDYDGKVYEIYYYPEDTDHDSTLVPVPGAGVVYTVCGNNVDGFIVTIETGESESGSSAQPVSETEENESEEATSEDSAEDDVPADDE